MNYEGLEMLRAGVASLANDMCDMSTRMNELTDLYRFDSEVLGERLTRQAVCRAKKDFMKAYNEIIALDACFKD